MASSSKPKPSPAEPATSAAALSISSGSSSSSSTTATELAPRPAAAPAPSVDVEAQNAPSNRMSHFALVRDQAGITPAVLAHQWQGKGTAEDPFVVEFLPGGDPRNPMTFSRTKKWSITILQAFATLAVAFVSTAYSGGVSEIIRDFHISTEVAILGISLFVLGFAIGPLLWAPLSVSLILSRGKMRREGEFAADKRM